jgi:hypothetical protein
MDNLNEILIRSVAESNDTENRIVQQILLPEFGCYLFSRKQIDILTRLHKKKQFVEVNFDATGTILKNPSLLNGVVLVFAMMMVQMMQMKQKN